MKPSCNKVHNLFAEFTRRRRAYPPVGGQAGKDMNRSEAEFTNTKLKNIFMSNKF